MFLCDDVHLIGLTGGIGMGKSAAGDWLERRRLPMTDSDRIAREVCAPGTPALREISERFGPEVVDEDGALRRGEVAKRVFGDDGARADLENILHPRIRAAWKAEVQDWGRDERVAGVVQIPLLFETDARGEFDSIICVACSPGVQKERLLGRGWDEEQIARRIGAQLPIREKIERSDFVVWNESGWEELGEQLDRALRAMGIALEKKTD